MTDRLPPLNALKVFESAARHLSLKRAAHELNVTPAAISHQVKQLEDYLGIQLFRRLNRGIELTPAARAALPQLSAGFEALAQAVAALRPKTDTGQLTISAAPSFATRWLVPRLHRFFSAHPEIDVRVSARLRRVKQGELDNDVELATLDSWLQESDIAILYGHGAADAAQGIEVGRTASVFALGLPASDPFWASPAEDWTQKKAWAGLPFKKDYAVDY